jgi:transmembrane sensor
MGLKDVEREEASLVAVRAAEWLGRLEAGRLQDRTEFVQWLEQSPRHVREVLLAETMDHVLKGVDPQREIDIHALAAKAAPISLSPYRTSAHVRGLRAHPYRWLASAAMVGAILTGLWMLAPAVWFAPTYVTAVGEQRTVTLDDGSMVHLNGHSRVRVVYSGDARQVQMLTGQALFEVKQDSARPFAVQVDGTAIKVLGTEFDVHRWLNHTTVAVLEGRVSVGPSTRLAAGQGVSITEGRVDAPVSIDISEVDAWRSRRLIFRKALLADVATEFNRYNREPQFKVIGEGARNLLFSGVFNANDPRALVGYLRETEDVSVEEGREEIVVRVRSRS